MQYRILLISILTLITLHVTATVVSFENPSQVNANIEAKVEKIKNTKNYSEKIKLLKDLKEFLRNDISERYLKMEKIYDKVLELENLQIDSESTIRADQIAKKKSLFFKEKEIHETLNDFNYAFKNIYLLFLEESKSNNLNCTKLIDDIKGSHLNTVPEGSLLPYHAKIAIQLSENLCASSTDQ